MLRKTYPRFIPLNSFVIPDEHMDFTVDFSNTMNSAPYTANMTMSMPALYSLFRNMGMRHLVVVNTDNEVLGIITRKEVAAPHVGFHLLENRISLFKKTLVCHHSRTSEEKDDYSAIRRRFRRPATTTTNYESLN